LVIEVVKIHPYNLYRQIYDVNPQQISIRRLEMRPMRLLLSITILLSILGSSGVIAAPTAPDSPDSLGTLTPIGGLESSLIFEIVLQGNYAYTGFASTLVVIDITDPSNLTRVASLRLGGQINAMVATEDYLYITSMSIPEPTNETGLWIVDISDPLAPVKAGFYPATWPFNIAVQGEIACLLVEDRLELIDVSNPHAPRLLGTLFDVVNFNDIAISDGYVYLAGWEVRIVDISDPAQPFQAGAYTPPEYSYTDPQIELSNSTLYYLDSYGLQVLDISSPTAPVLAGTLDLYNQGSMDIALSGDTVYLATHVCLYDSFGGVQECFGGVQIIDASVPVSPTLSGEYRSNDLTDITSISTAGGYVFLTHPGEVQSIDATLPSSPVLVDILESPLDIPDEFVVAGDYAYITNYWLYGGRFSLRIADISDPSQPVVVGQFETGSVVDVDVFGNTVILTEVDDDYPFERSSTYFIDVSNPQSPVEIGRYDSSEGNFSGVDVQGGYAYLTWEMASDLEWPEGTEDKVYVLDISDPTAPREVGIYELPLTEPFHKLYDIVVWGSYAYLLADEGLLILDVSDPENPVKVGEYFEPYVRDIALSGDYLFLAYASGISVLDIWNPAQPVEISTYDMDDYDYPTGIAFQEGLLYGASSSGLSVLDVSVRTTPTLVATFQSQSLSYSTDVSVQEDEIYFTTSEGFLILNLTGSISGVVRSPNRSPVPGVIITTNGTVTDTTDSKGVYLFEDLEPDSYTLTPFLAGYTFTPQQIQMVVPPSQVANFTLLPLPVSAVLTPGITTTLTYTDTQGLPTSFIFPQGLVSSTTTAYVTPTLGTAFFSSAFTGHAFDLALRAGEEPASSMTFSVPVSVTIQYSPEDTAVIIDTASLALYHLEEGGWVEANYDCDSGGTPPAQEPGIFRGVICQDGTYALFGATHAIALPQVSCGSDASEIIPP
jgi:hypothetical protein